MASSELPNYLRTYRKRLGLSQDEVAFLLGVESSAKVSRYEGFTRQPSLETILALELILQKPAHELFGGPYQQIEHEVTERAKLLLQRVAKDRSDPSRDRKLKTLNAIISNSS